MHQTRAVPSDFRLRVARLDDAVRLAELSATLGYPVADDSLRARLARLLARPTDLVLVAESAAGQVIGWVHAAEQELLESERRCEILGLVVDSRHRGRGTGRDLRAERTHRHLPRRRAG